MILLVGANGSMGKRYQAILNHLGMPYVPVDIGERCQNYDVFKGTIIATPTETHSFFIKECSRLGPVLCEKPISTTLTDLNDILDHCRDENIRLTMMNQYKLLDDEFASGHTSYDFYNTGKDGLHWDCMQIIGAARSSCEIRNQSPIWNCRLNGKQIDIGLMDKAYVEFVRKWLTFSKIQDLEYIREMHYKAAQFGR